MCEVHHGATSNQVPEHLTEYIRSIAGKEGYKNYDLQITPISSGGANYMSNIFTAKVSEEDKTGLNLFAKVTNAPPETREFMSINTIFERESFVISTLADIFENIQQKHNIPEDERYRFPKHYGSNLKDFKETIVMENLIPEDYIVYDRFKSIDWEFAKAAIDKLAKYHALCFVFGKDDPEFFKTAVASRNEILQSKSIFDDRNKNDFWKSVLDATHNAVDDQYRERLMKLTKKLEDINNILVHYQPTDHSVLLHGDYKMSNLLIKYDDDRVSSLIPVDFQTIYYGSPVNDLMYFIFTGSDGAFRKNHYEDSIGLYYDTLSSFLAKLGEDANDIYPEEAFRADLKDKLEFGFTMAIFLLPFITADANETPEIADVLAGKEPLIREDNTFYRKRLNELVSDFVAWGVL